MLIGASGRHSPETSHSLKHSQGRWYVPYLTVLSLADALRNIRKIIISPRPVRHCQKWFSTVGPLAYPQSPHPKGCCKRGSNKSPLIVELSVQPLLNITAVSSMLWSFFCLLGWNRYFPSLQCPLSSKRCQIWENTDFAEDGEDSTASRNDSIGYAYSPQVYHMMQRNLSNTFLNHPQDK